MITLSILICHLEDRVQEIGRLIQILVPQVTERVEYLIETDKGEMSVGQKRNKLIQRAQGEYVAFVDDDDTVSCDYVSKILSAIDKYRENHGGTSPDCIGLEGEMFYENRAKFNFKHSIQFAGWYTGGDAFIRTPNHLNPVLRRIAVLVPFPEKFRGEDQSYSHAIKRLLKTEQYIRGPIYKYNYTEKVGDFA
jgi:hypothetical protein